MSTFCPDEAVRYVGTALLDCLSRPAACASLVSPVRLRFGLIDPDCVLYIDTATREVRLGAPGERHDVDTTDRMVAMNGETAVRLCQGLLDVDAALELGDIATEGECRTLLRLITDDDTLPVRYAEAVRREGRADLLDTAPALAG